MGKKGTLVNTTPIERATTTEPKRMVRRFQNLLAIALSLTRLIPEIRSDVGRRLAVYFRVDRRVRACLVKTRSVRNGLYVSGSPGRGLNPGPAAFSSSVQGRRSTTELPGLVSGGGSGLR